MINLGAIVGILSIPCAIILFFIKSTSVSSMIALGLAPFFIVFAAIFTIWLSIKYRITVIFLTPFIVSLMVGFSAPDRSSLSQYFSSGLGFYSGALGIFSNLIFITSLVAAGGCIFALAKINKITQFHPIKIILTAIGLFYALAVTAIATIILIGISKTDWF